MMHIDEGKLLAFLDQETQPDERREIERHLASCEACRADLSDLRSLSAHFSGAMAHLDGPPRARQHAIGWPRTARFAGVRRMLPRAAVLVLFAGAAASATIPGSPVREWLSNLGAPQAVVEPFESEVSAEGPVAPAEAPMETGVSVEAADGIIEIVLRDAGKDLSARAIFVDGTRAGVYAAGEATSSRFQTGAGRIEVLNARAGDMRIELPRGAAVVTVIVNGREYLRRQDGRLDVRVGTSDGDPGEIDFSVEP